MARNGILGSLLRKLNQVAYLKLVATREILQCGCNEIRLDFAHVKKYVDKRSRYGFKR